MISKKNLNTHMHIHTYIKELFALKTVHVPVFLHTRTQQLRVAPDEKKYSGCMCTFVNQIKTIKLFKYETSSPKGNDAHLRATIQSEKKLIDQFFRRLRAANSVVRGRIWLNFKFIQALMYVIITGKYEKDPIKNNREKVATRFFKL